MPKNSSKLLNNFARGFTLIEVLVSLSLIALVSLVAIPNYQRFSRGQTLDTDSSRLLESLKTVSSNSLYSINCSTAPVPPNTPSPGSKPYSVGWGIHFSDNKTYNTYALCVNNPTNTNATPPPSPLDTVSLDADVTAEWSLPVECTVSSLYLVFVTSNNRQIVRLGCTGSPPTYPVDYRDLPNNFCITLTLNSAKKYLSISPGGAISLSDSGCTS